jgi:hypothetical protein
MDWLGTDLSIGAVFWYSKRDCGTDPITPRKRIIFFLKWMERECWYSSEGGVTKWFHCIYSSYFSFFPLEKGEAIYIWMRPLSGCGYPRGNYWAATYQQRMILIVNFLGRIQVAFWKMHGKTGWNNSLPGSNYSKGYGRDHGWPQHLVLCARLTITLTNGSNWTSGRGVAREGDIFS